MKLANVAVVVFCVGMVVVSIIVRQSNGPAVLTSLESSGSLVGACSPYTQVEAVLFCQASGYLGVCADDEEDKCRSRNYTYLCERPAVISACGHVAEYNDTAIPQSCGNGMYYYMECKVVYDEDGAKHCSFGDREVLPCPGGEEYEIVEKC